MNVYGNNGIKFEKVSLNKHAKWRATTVLDVYQSDDTFSNDMTEVAAYGKTKEEATNALICLIVKTTRNLTRKVA